MPICKIHYCCYEIAQISLCIKVSSNTKTEVFVSEQISDGIGVEIYVKSIHIPAKTSCLLIFYSDLKKEHLLLYKMVNFHAHFSFVLSLNLIAI